jgi:hypothetical protein
MVNKAQVFTQLAEKTAKRLTSCLEDWTGFLNTVGRLYRYNYHIQHKPLHQVFVHKS